MQEEYGQDGVTLGEIWRAVRRKIWILLAVSLAVAAVGALLVGLVVNPLTASYEIEFTVRYPGRDTLKYPDGSPFYYQDLVSEASLAAVKAQDERFSSIDTEKIVDEDDASVSAETADVGGAAVQTGRYTVSIARKYFPGEAVANDFMKALAKLPEQRVKETAAALDYSVDAQEYDGASFSAQLSLLLAQKEAMLAQYDEWIELLGGSYRNNATGRTLLSYRSSVEVVFDEAVRSSLLRELDLCGYVPAGTVEAERSALAAEYEINEKAIAEIVEKLKEFNGGPVAASATAPTTAPSVPAEDKASLSESLAELILRNESIRYRLGTKGEGWTGGQLTEENVAVFARKVAEQYAALNAAAATTKAVSAAIFSQEARTTFEIANVGTEGGVSVPLVAVAAFIIALLVGAVVVCARAFSHGKASPAGAEPGKEAETEGDGKRENETPAE